MNTIVTTMQSNAVELRKKFRLWWYRKQEQALVRFFRLAFSHDAVQRAVLAELEHQPRMCRMLREHIENVVEEQDREVDADDVNGLESKIEGEIESYLENYDIEASNVSGLDEHIDDYLSNNLADTVRDELSNQIGDAVKAALADHEQQVDEITEKVVAAIVARLESK